MSGIDRPPHKRDIPRIGGVRPRLPIASDLLALASVLLRRVSRSVHAGARSVAATVRRIPPEGAIGAPECRTIHGARGAPVPPAAGHRRTPRRSRASLIYGGGLRVSECCQLRVKDLDFESGRWSTPTWFVICALRLVARLTPCRPRPSLGRRGSRGHSRPLISTPRQRAASSKTGRSICS